MAKASKRATISSWFLAWMYRMIRYFSASFVCCPANSLNCSRSLGVSLVLLSTALMIPDVSRCRQLLWRSGRFWRIEE